MRSRLPATLPSASVPKRRCARATQYRGIFETSADALLLWDANYRVVDVNRAYERFYAKRREAVVGKTMEEVLPPQIVHQRRELVRRALQGETSELQTTGVRRDGSTFDLELRFVPFEHGGKPHVLAIGRDITERKRAENALRASEGRIARSSRLRPTRCSCSMRSAGWLTSIRRTSACMGSAVRKWSARAWQTSCRRRSEKSDWRWSSTRSKATRPNCRRLASAETARPLSSKYE